MFGLKPLQTGTADSVLYCDLVCDLGRVYEQPYFPDRLKITIQTLLNSGIYNSTNLQQSACLVTNQIAVPMFLSLTLYLIDMPFNSFANRTDPDQTALVWVYSVCLWKYESADPKLVGLPSNFFVLCTNMKVYLYNYS